MNDNFSRLCSALMVLLGSYEDTRLADASFDAGEFSGPATERDLERTCREVCVRYGYTTEEARAELVSRTSARWVHFSGLDRLFPVDDPDSTAPDPTAPAPCVLYCPECGRSFDTATAPEGSFACPHCLNTDW